MYDVDLCVILATIQGVLTAMAGAGAPVAVHLPHLGKGPQGNQFSVSIVMLNKEQINYNSS